MCSVCVYIYVYCQVRPVQQQNLHCRDLDTHTHVHTHARKVHRKYIVVAAYSLVSIAAIHCLPCSSLANNDVLRAALQDISPGVRTLFFCFDCFRKSGRTWWLKWRKLSSECGQFNPQPCVKNLTRTSPLPLIGLLVGDHIFAMAFPHFCQQRGPK